ncbi:MAG: ABC transporter permease, partial [Alphaproteobacteria bacterium]|nr:ABC transporter permease [Alphaproteobacteria bacterium]
MRAFSLQRLFAVLAKEFIQMRRDRLTAAMVLGIPVLQLMLFCFAINLNPKNLPTAVSVDDPGRFSRSILAALVNSSYFQIVGQTNSPKEARRLLDQGKVTFVVEIPANFTRDVV